MERLEKRGLTAKRSSPTSVKWAEAVDSNGSGFSASSRRCMDGPNGWRMLGRDARTRSAQSAVPVASSGKPASWLASDEPAVIWIVRVCREDAAHVARPSDPVARKGIHPGTVESEQFLTA